MNRLLKVIGAALVFGGTVWAFMAFGDLAPGAPAWSAWMGPLAITLGFPLLFLFGARHGEEVWDAGEWIEAGGTVRGVGTVEFGVRLRLRLSGTRPRRLEHRDFHRGRAPARAGGTVQGGNGGGSRAIERPQRDRGRVGRRGTLVSGGAQPRARPYCFS